MRRTLLTLVAVLLLAGCADREIVVQPFDRAPVPPVPDRTAEVPAGGAPLADGQYWAVDVALDGTTVTLTLQQAFVGPTCTSVLGADHCDGDIGVRTEPSRAVRADPTGMEPISVAAPNGQNYALTPSSLIVLLSGDTKSLNIPPGYEYTPFPFLATVSGGVVTGLQQIWTA